MLLHSVIKYRVNDSLFQVHARELYLRDSDPLEVYNVADMPVYKPLVEEMRKKLIAGWREAMPKQTLG